MLQKFFACLQFPTDCGEIISESILLHISIVLRFHKFFTKIHTETFDMIECFTSVVFLLKIKSDEPQDASCFR